MGPRAHLLLAALLLLLLLLAEVSLQADPPCVEPCTCNGRQVRGDTTTFHLLCGRDVYIRALPDWSPLTSVDEPIALSLYVDKLRKLERGDFPAGLRLVSIDIVGNTHIDPDVFQNVRDSLTDLQLHSHRLNLSSGTLDFLQGLTRLRRLVLINVSASDKDQHVNGSLFAGLGLEHLEYLKITDSKIASVGPEAFRDLGVEEMSLASNKIASFPGEALRKVKHLRSLDLFGNRIARLRKGDVDGLSLEWLSLAANEVSSVEEGALSGLAEHLHTLRLDDNGLTRVPTQALAPLSRLEKLDLRGNPIANVSSRAFQGSYCLQELRLGSPARLLEHMTADALQDGGRCLQTLELLNARDFPSGALREGAPAAREVSVSSPSLSVLRTGALSGVHVWRLSIRAPLRTVEQGAFQNLSHRPISLSLDEARLSSLDFFFHYAAGTFADLHVSSPDLPCDCEVASVQHNLQLHARSLPLPPAVAVDFPSLRDLTGTCQLEGSQRNVHDQDVLEAFAQCSNLTVLPLPPEVVGDNGATAVSSSFPRAVLVVVLVVVVMAWGSFL